MVDIEHLRVVFREGEHGLLALDDVGLRLRPGRVLGLVGESGSGKTTLGRAMMGLLPSNGFAEGSIRLGERELIGLDEATFNTLRWTKVAMVFQNGAANLNPVHRIVDQVAEPLIQHRGMGKREARSAAESELLRLGLSAELVRRYPHEASGGQIQRALLAMAMILDPEVLILDEPTAALDAMSKGLVTEVIEGLRGRQKAVLLITHDLDLAGQIADELVVLYLGQVMERMPGGDLFSRPRHPYTLALGRSFPGMDATRDLGGIRGEPHYRLLHAHSREGGGTEHVHIQGAGTVSDPARETGHAPAEGCIFLPRCTQAVPECAHKTVPLQRAGDHWVRCVRGGIATILECRGLSKRYGPSTALHPTDLVVRAGEVLCLVGETGSGKTTLAMAAAGTLHLDTGRRVFQGRDMEDWMKQDYPSLARKIGVVYQNPAQAVSHRFSVFDIVTEPLRIQKPFREKREVHDRVLKALADVRLPTEPAFLARYPHELNMGAIQRLCIARALVSEPSFLVADEPTSALDPGIQARVMKLLLDLQIEKGLALLFVTHDLGLARKIADRIGVMFSGRLVEIGPAARVMGCPAHPYTRFLMESARGQGKAYGPVPNGGLSAGCSFAQSCERAEERCRQEVPPPVDAEGLGRTASCFNPLRAPDTGPMGPAADDHGHPQFSSQAAPRELKDDAL